MRPKTGTKKALVDESEPMGEDSRRRGEVAVLLNHSATSLLEEGWREALQWSGLHRVETALATLVAGNASGCSANSRE